MNAPERLPDGTFLRDPALGCVLACLIADRPPDSTRIIGGAVRDALMGRPVGDVDLATVLEPSEVTARAEAAGFKVVPTGLAFGTVTIVADGRGFEVTTLRRDIETDGRHAVVSFGDDWAADAARRDFTVNALSCAAGGRLFDPLGGYGDVVARRVRFIGNADQRIAEDYLRVLRFFRFHAEFGAGPLDPAGLAASVRARRGMARLSRERVRQECAKLFVAPGACATLEVLAETGVLVDIVGVPAIGRMCRLADIEAATDTSSSFARRLAALAVRIPEDAARLTDRLALSTRETSTLMTCAVVVPRLVANPERRSARRELHQAGASYRDAILVAWAEVGAASDDATWAALAALPEMDPIPAFPLRGADLIAAGVSPGPEIGRRLALAESAWVASDFTLGRAELLAIASA